MSMNLCSTVRQYLERFRHAVVIAVVAGYIAYHYQDYIAGTAETAPYILDEEDIKLLKQSLLEQGLIYQEQICSGTTNYCYFINDIVTEDNGDIAVIRVMMLDNAQLLSFSNAQLEFPKVITSDNVVTKKWPVNKRKLVSSYAGTMVGMSFAMEALVLEPKSTQQVLMIGLGGGVINNFFSTLDTKTMINLTTIELDIDVLDVAVKWFQMVETTNNRVLIQDGVDFVREASERGDKYKAIIIDACYSDLRPTSCPVKEFYDPETIQHIADILDNDGVVSVNVLLTGIDKREGELIMERYAKHFASCFYAYLHLPQNLKLQQQILLCTHLKNWRYKEQKSRFASNLQALDEAFGLQLKNAFYTD